MTENLKNVAPVEDFDWAAYAEGDSYSKENRENLPKATTIR